MHPTNHLHCKMLPQLLFIMEVRLAHLYPLASRYHQLQSLAAHQWHWRRGYSQSWDMQKNFFFFLKQSSSHFDLLEKSIVKNIVSFLNLCKYCVECNPKLSMCLTGVNQHKSAEQDWLIQTEDLASDVSYLMLLHIRWWKNVWSWWISPSTPDR